MTDRATGAPRWLVLLVGVVLGLLVLGFALRGDGEPRGPRSSSFATSAEGARAYAELLRTAGHRVRRLRAPLDEEAPPAGAILVALDPGGLSAGERDAVAAFVRDGGRLLAAGRGAADLGAAVGLPELRDTGRGAPELVPTLPAPETVGVRKVAAAGERSFTRLGPGLPILAADGRRVGGLVVRAGRGTAVLLADSSPLRNRRLAQADNALLGLRLAGADRRPVAFVESVHGYEPIDGLAAIPADWKAALGVLALGSILLLLTRVRRLGPPELAARELPPPRAAYVEALSVTLARTGDRDAIAPVHAAARRTVARRARLGATPTAQEYADAAAALGLSAAEASAVAASTPAAADPLDLGRALARLHPDLDPDPAGAVP